MAQRNASKIISTLFFLLFILHTSFQIKTFGIKEGTYFWFCNIALLLGSIAVYKKNQNGILILLSILLPTQLPWILDYSKRAITGTDYFGLTEGLYHPGVTLLGFILGHYHYFLIPLLLFVYFNSNEFPKPKISWYFILALIILPISFWVFPYEQNVNCVHANCLEAIGEWSGKTYFTIFSIVILLLSFSFGFLWKKIGQTSKHLSTHCSKVPTILILFGLIFLILGIKQKNKIPSFHCKGPYEDSNVKIQCEFLVEHVKDWMALHYTLKNKTNKIQECSSFIEFEGKKELFQNALTLQPLGDLPISILIHYPNKNTTIQLSAECNPL